MCSSCGARCVLYGHYGHILASALKHMHRPTKIKLQLMYVVYIGDAKINVHAIETILNINVVQGKNKEIDSA